MPEAVSVNVPVPVQHRSSLDHAIAAAALSRQCRLLEDNRSQRSAAYEFNGWPTQTETRGYIAPLLSRPSFVSSAS